MPLPLRDRLERTLHLRRPAGTRLPRGNYRRTTIMSHRPPRADSGHSVGGQRVPVIDPLRPLPEAGLGASRGSRAAIHSVYLLTSSARRSTDCGIVMLRALTAFNMMTSSNFVGCCIGSSRKAQGQGVPRLARRGGQPQSQTETGRRPLISEARCGDRHTLNGICPVKS